MGLLLSLMLAAATSQPAALQGLSHEAEMVPDGFVWGPGLYGSWGRYPVVGNCAGDKQFGEGQLVKDNTVKVFCDDDTLPFFCMVQVWQVGAGNRYFIRGCDGKEIAIKDSAGNLTVYGTEVSETQYFWELGQALLGKATPCSQRNY